MDSDRFKGIVFFLVLTGLLFAIVFLSGGLDQLARLEDETWSVSPTSARIPPQSVPGFAR